EDGIRDRNVTGVQTCALPIYFILAIAFCMFPVMVLIMSVYGLIMTALRVGIEGSISIAYLKIIGLNFSGALPSQLLIVGPISRRSLGRYIKPSTQDPAGYASKHGSEQRAALMP